ncbi:hypothetical protein HOA55_02230 [archaeon]|jgi:intein/homing endonuclease|nr:hypothetical protein [archaeon]MBT3577602.1 hypothetical protein [archaeon]MBT6820150.1 hypothetical protein [archaeon]MBT6956561.1 hypothetical protein [archaeon]MBT7025692.1 hypothetical protein [archaeon]
MRIKLVRGKQSELVSLAKVAKTWNTLAKMLGLSEVYVRHYLKKEKRLLSDLTYKKLCKIAEANFDDFIVDKLHNNWGRVKGGRLSSGKTIKNIDFPVESEKFAEFYGAMLGDGNLNRTKGYRVGTYMARIVGDRKLDYEYHINYLKPLMEELFGLVVRIGGYGNGAIHITIYSKLLVDFLENKGFKPGDKIKNKLNIPDWIKKNDDFLRACLRGLFDTDGGMYQLNDQKTCQIAFTNHNFTLLNDVRDSLIKLGIVPSKIVSGRRVYITKKSELQKFLKLIGFSNPRHSKKIGMFNLAP